MCKTKHKVYRPILPFLEQTEIFYICTIHQSALGEDALVLEDPVYYIMHTMDTTQGWVEPRLGLNFGLQGTCFEKSSQSFQKLTLAKYILFFLFNLFSNE